MAIDFLFSKSQWQLEERDETIIVLKLNRWYLHQLTSLPPFQSVQNSDNITYPQG